MHRLLPLLCLSILWAKPPILVEPAWVESNQAKLTILHVGAEKDFQEAHLPGARLVTLADISKTGPNGLRLELLEPEQLQAAFLKLGLSDRRHTVVYAGNESLQSATRVWFTLDYLGVPASLLNGGLAAWKAAGKPVSQQPPAAVVPGTLRIRPQPNRLISKAEVQQRNASVRLLDGRLPEFYTGKSPGIASRAGHIPGARNVPFPTLLGQHNQFRSKAELEQLLGKGGTMASYCHIGQQATVLYFAARWLGQNAKLYDGSFQDWSADNSLPVETTPAPTGKE